MDYSVEGVTTRHAVPMTRSLEGTSTSPISAATVTALVVERTLSDALTVASMLTASHFHVTVAETFPKAKARLGAQIPGVLITEVRLAEYNGLHLVLRGKSLAPEMAAVVLSSVNDRVLQADAESLGATFVIKPLVESELTAAVFRTIFRTRHGGTDVVRAPFERRRGERRASVRSVAEERRATDRRRDLDALLKAAAGA